jgi:16S rRNA G966 N2-methylase RsmD
MQLRFNTARFFTAQERTLTVLSKRPLRRTTAPAPGAIFRALAENPRALELFEGS